MACFKLSIYLRAQLCGQPWLQKHFGVSLALCKAEFLLLFHLHS